MDKRDRILIELVHYLTLGSNKIPGLDKRALIRFFNTPIKSKNNRTPIECIELDGRAFLNELLIYLKEIEDDL